MKVIVNATPLIALAILQRLELLPQLFEDIELALKIGNLLPVKRSP